MSRCILTAVLALALLMTTGCGESAAPAADRAAAVEAPAHGGARMLIR